MAKKKLTLTDQEDAVIWTFIQCVGGLLTTMDDLDDVRWNSLVREELLRRLHAHYSDEDLTALGLILRDATDPEFRCPQ